MKSRREFLKSSALGAAGLGALGTADALGMGTQEPPPSGREQVRADGGHRRAGVPDPELPDATVLHPPCVVSTWGFGVQANEAAWSVLASGGYALDALLAGTDLVEADPEVTTVGRGGLPDRTGRVTLDAAVMDERGDAGAVVFLEGILHPTRVARRVMERTPHVLLAGEGALAFAREEGFEEVDLLTPRAREAWRAWRRENGALPRMGPGNHDTLGMLALDASGRVCGACTTSGAAWKVRGRVGDSPIPGAGLYVDGAVGGACATGLGEEVLKSLGSYLVVELMRGGAPPAEACREAADRIARRHAGGEIPWVGFLALDLRGGVGACSTLPEFHVALRDGAGGRLLDPPHLHDAPDAVR